MKDETRCNRYKIALVTGASSGIGLALARELGKRGVRLVLSGRNEAGLSEFRESALEIVVADLGTRQGVERVQEAVRAHKPDLVINNAGLGFFGAPTIENSHEIIQVNVTALVDITLTARDVWLREKRAGVIMNIGSVLSFFPTPEMSVYAASKAFVSSFSEALDYELEGSGIRVLTACPGQVVSNFRARASHGRSVPETSFFRMTSEEAAVAILQQIEDGCALAVVNWRARLLYWIARLLPKRLMWHYLSRDIKRRMNG